MPIMRKQRRTQTVTKGRGFIMTKEDWIRKLTSRKFWMAIAGLVVGAVNFLQHPTTDAETITSLILALGSVVAYVISEGLVDAAREGSTMYIDEPEQKPPEADEE